MKVSLNWAQAQSNVPLSDGGVNELVEKIGAQLGAVEEVINYGSRYDGIVIAKVISCIKHPNADKLSICTIDDGGITPGVNRGENNLVQVVCGAPNAREGLLVAWLPPGVTVPSTIDKDPFVLETREIRGQVSSGMLASPSELALYEDHGGILEIEEPSAKPGQPFKELYGLDDVVIDIENKMFTHRPDCFGVLGVARELAGIQGKQFASPDWYLRGSLSNQQERDVQLNINVETDLVSRFLAVAMKHVTVGPSPVWLQAGLTRVGLKPINNIVDITNYLMYVTGQPLHAYDADKLPTPHTLGARMSRAGEKVNLLNGKELELKDDTSVVITSGDTVVGVGGVMGGKDTEVSAETKNIIIECASFDMYNIRRTSMKYGLFTDAVTRFNKGQSNLQNQAVLARAITFVQELAEGMQSSNAVDVCGQLATREPVRVSTRFINERLGSNLNTGQVSSLLTNVEFDVVLQDELIITAPFWRTDIEIAEDIVEEVGRLHGFDNLPLSLPSRPAKPAHKNELIELKARLRNILSAAGANELLTYSFVHGNLLEKAGQNSDEAYQLSNALSPDLQYFRTSLTPSLLERVHSNVKAGYLDFAVFEMGVTHSKQHTAESDGLPGEHPALAFVATSTGTKHPAFYQVRAYLDHMAKALGMNFRYQAITTPSELPVSKPYDPARSALVVDQVSGETVGIVGELNGAVIRGLKLPGSTAAFEVELDKLIGLSREANYRKLPKYPSSQQDISLKTPANVSYQTVYETLAVELLGKQDTLASLKPLDIYQRPDDAGHTQYSFRLQIAHFNKTMTSEEVNALLDQAAAVAKAKFGADRL